MRGFQLEKIDTLNYFWFFTIIINDRMVVKLKKKKKLQKFKATLNIKNDKEKHN